jgi:UPF0716 protein FxsA
MIFQYKVQGRSGKPLSGGSWKWVLLFVGLPLLELFLLIEIGRWFGWLSTLWLVLITGVVGGSLAHRQGFAALVQIQAGLAAGRVPGRQMVEGLLILIAGLVMITPGLLTDLLGFTLLVPMIRARVAARLIKKFSQPMMGKSPSTPFSDDSNHEDVIDV